MRATLGVALLLGLSPMALPAAAAQVVLDRSITAGRYWLFPLAGDPHTYLYAVGQAQLARHPNGKPQFSFLRFADNELSEGGSSSLTEAAGGGILHAVVELGVPEDQRQRSLEAARRALQQVDPAGKVVGAVSYTSGKFMLVSSFKEEDEERAGREKWVEKVVAFDEAPILEGGRAAISIRLTREGAKVLWESFHSTTPDISFVFQMQVDGVKSPIQAKLVVNWEQMYSNEQIQLGVVSPMTEIEVDLAFEELRQQGAIQFTQIGDGDTNFDAMVKDAYEKIRDLMFHQQNGLVAKGPGATAAAAVAGQTKTPAQRAEALRGRSKGEREGRASAYASRLQGQETKAKEARQKANDAAKAAREARARVSAAELERPPSAGPETAEEQEEEAAGSGEAGGQAAGDAGAQAGDGAGTGASADDDREQQGTDRDRERGRHEQRVGGLDREAVAAEEEAARLARVAEEEEQRLEELRGKREDFEESVDSLVEDEFSAAFTYKLKEQRQTLNLELDFNKYRSGTQKLRFDENIGDLRRYLEDDAVFRAVNLDDPLYKQREIAVAVDGSNSADFKEYINYVNVQLKKEHQNGDSTVQEVRIDRKNFTENANDFRMLYGWKGDSDRVAWMEYQYRALWSFFGGNSVEQGWSTATEGTIPLVSPYQRRSVEIDGDPDDLGAAGVRAVVFTLYYDLAGVEKSERVMLKTSKGEFNKKVDFMLPEDSYAYEYEIVWMLEGNRSVSSGRQPGDSPILFVNDVPEA